MTFLERFPGIGRQELIDVVLAVYRARNELAKEHDCSMLQLEGSPGNDSFRIKESILREEVDMVETRMKRLVQMLRDAPLETPEDLPRMMMFEVYMGSLSAPPEDYIDYLHACFSQKFRKSIKSAPRSRRTKGAHAPSPA